MATVETRFVATGVGETQAGCSSVARGISNVSTAANSASSSLDHLGSSASGLNSSLVQLLGSLRNILVAWLSLKQISDVFANAMKTALDYNKTLENSRLGIAAIITSMASITDESGRQLQGQQKFNAAMQVAISQQRQLEVIAMSTAATYQELVTVYQALLAPAMAAKLTLGQTVTLTGLMTNSVKAMGLPMNQIVQESRDMLTGNIDNNSQLAKSLGITREMVKEWTTKRTLFDEITKRLEGFTYASREFENTWDGAVSNLKDALQKALGSGMQPLMRPLVGGVQAIANAFLDVDRNVDGTVKTIQVKRSLIETIYTYIANPLYKAWLVVQGAVETINSLFLQQNGVLRIVTDAVKIMLGWVVGIADGWGWIVSTVLPSVAAALGKVNEILTMMLVSAYDFGNLLLNAMRAVGESLGAIMKAAWQGITGDFQGAGETLAGMFKGKAVDNMRGWSSELQKNMAGAKTAVSGLGVIWDQFLDKTVAWQQGLKKGESIIPGEFGVKGKSGSGKATETDFNRTKAIGDAMRAWQEAYWAWEDAGHKAKAKSAIDTLQWQHEQGLKTTREYLDEKERLEKGVVEREIERNNKRIADMQSSLSITMGPGKDPNSDQALKHAQAQEQLIKALTKQIELEAQLEAIGNKAGIDREKDQIKKKDQLLAAEVALLNAQGNSVAAAEKQIEVDQRGRLQMDDKTRAVYEQIDALKVMKAVFDEMNALSAITNQTADINNSMISDPYEQKRAQMEAAYAREMELINQKISLTESGSEKELALAEQRYALQIKLAEDLRNNKLDQDKASWEGVVSAAQKAFPKLTGLDKALHAVFKDHTVKRLATEDERAKGSEKMVKDETRSNLSMYGAYAGAAGAVFEGLAATQDTASRSGFETAKAFNIAAAVMNTASAVMNAMATVPYPMNIAAAVATGAMGAIQIANIASTSFGGGAKVPTVSAPAGSYGAAGGTGASLGSMALPMMSISDSMDSAGMDMLVAATDNNSVALGRLSKSMDSLSAMFEKGGPGMMLALGTFNAYAPKFFTSPDHGSAWSGFNVGVEDGKTTGLTWSLNYNKKTGYGWVGPGAGDSTAATDHFSALLDPYMNDLVRIVRTLGTTIDLNKLNVAPATIVTSGRDPEDIAKDIENYMVTVLQNAALLTDGLDGLIGTFENGYARLKEFNDALVSTNDAFLLIGKTQLQGSLSTGELLNRMQRDLFGGLEGFNEAIDSYFSIMYSDAEQTARKGVVAQQKLGQAFAEINVYMTQLGRSNIDIPKTREEFRALVDAIDITEVIETADGIKPIGAQLFGALINVRDAFGTVMTAADELAEQRRDLDNQIMELSGNAAGALAARRADELAALDASLRPLQERIYALEDEKTALDDAKTALDTATESLRASFSAEKDRLTAAYNSELSLLTGNLNAAKSVVTDLTGSINKLTAARERMKLQDEAYQRSEFQAAQARLASVLVQARGGDLSGIKNLDKSLETLTGITSESYASSTDYQRDFWQTKNAILELETLAGSQLSDAQRTVQLAETQINVLKSNHESQLQALDAQLNALLGINNSVLSLTDAISQFITAKSATISTPSSSAAMSYAAAIDSKNVTVDQVAAEQSVRGSAGQIYAQIVAKMGNEYGETLATVTDLYRAASVLGLPGFAVGTSYVPYDMTANIHQGEIIIDRASSDVLRKYGIPTYGSADNSALADEVRELRRENRELNAKLERVLSRIADSSDRTARATNGNPDAPIIVEVVNG